MSNSKLIRLQIGLARSANHMVVFCRRAGMTRLACHWAMRRNEHMAAARLEQQDDPCPIFGTAAVRRFQ